jgi:predicted ArsR family transcriptional regulator
VTMRRLNARWVAAGRRRIVARGLRAEGKTFQQIGKELGVSSEQARRDCQ